MAGIAIRAESRIRSTDTAIFLRDLPPVIAEDSLVFERILL